ncbi:COX15/CtaA family protein [Solicola gregarius]|uniref:COX15/CtaA family protein n=1 Tax=Solicola gregarius TaxID=2908642 RepID=A0AA46YKW1_9ACTN|nr:COX15/CtaA family protein [Solicola gregarius]UYM04916.1 COX15/CtaA family protein [Solicola gregarius]
MRRLIEAFRTPTAGLVRGLTIANLVANIGIVVTGGAVRLTGSGLGCPTWPQCTEDSLTPHSELGVYGIIEFGNRLLTYVLVAIAIATWFAILRWRPRRRNALVLATAIALGIPFQGVIGGITVLTDLNPWVVALHMMLSMGLSAAATVLMLWVRRPPDIGGPPVLPGPVRHLVGLTYLALWVTVYLGTIVTGSGPHAGDLDARRNGLDPAAMSQLHADSVFVLLGLTVGCVFAVRAVGGPVRLAYLLLGTELAQGTIGFVQYLTDLPVVLVGIHMLGAAVLVAAGTALVVVAHAPAELGSARPRIPRTDGAGN